MKALGLLDNVEREGQPSLHSSYTKCINKDLRYLKDLLNFSKLLVFILLCATSQAKVSTLYDTLNFHKNLAREKWPKFDMDKTIKNYFIENKFKGDNGQTLAS